MGSSKGGRGEIDKNTNMYVGERWAIISRAFPFEFDKANCAIEYGVNCGRDFMRDTSGDDYAKHMSRKWTRERPREPRSTEVPRKTWID